jgi:hypothetical protein
MSEFPKWFYGPNDQAKVFEDAESVPAGWQDHPSKVVEVNDIISTETAPKRGRKPKVVEHDL